MSQDKILERLLEKPAIDRNDVAQLIGTTVVVVAKNEQNLGIAPARVNINSRNIRYHTLMAIDGLRAKGVLPPTTQQTHTGTQKPSIPGDK